MEGVSLTAENQENDPVGGTGAFYLVEFLWRFHHAANAIALKNK
jgi:hypothetical protein